MSGFEIELPSSPDPLGDEEPSSAVPPSTIRPSTTRRILQSAVSSRFSARPGTSPRKRMFALDVGDEITPQTIYVTVEAGEDGNPIAKDGGGGSNVRRRLFGSPTPQPSPRRRQRTTTTTVPLRGLTDDEADPTPRRRRRSSGRPGTPATSAGKRKKRSTPTPKATRKPRGTPVASSDALQSETPTAVTNPTPKRRGRPPKRKADNAPSEQADPNTAEALPRKRGRRRKSLDADEIALLSTASNDGAESEANRPRPAQGSDALRDALSDPVGEEGPADQEEEGGKEDIWMANMSDLSSDGHRRPPQEGERLDSSVYAAGLEVEPEPPQLDDQDILPGESDDFAPMMDFDDTSDVNSCHDESPIQADPPELQDQGPLPGESDDYPPLMDNDVRSETQSHPSEQTAKSGDEPENTLDPESFTMIGIESMHSFRGRRGVPTSDLPEIGETTSFIINKTLDSLRQEMAASDDDEEDEVDVLESTGQTPAGAEPQRPVAMTSSPRNRGQPSQSPANTSPWNNLRSPRAKPSSGRAAPRQSHNDIQSPSRVRQSSETDNSRPDADDVDEDSFSDIPEEVLAAAGSLEEWQPSRPPSEDELRWAVGVVKDMAAEKGYSRMFNSVDPQISDPQGSTHSIPTHSHWPRTDDIESLSQRSASRSIQSKERSSQAIQKSSPPHSIRSRSESNRLLTPPDETTSSNAHDSPADHNAPNEDVQLVTSDDIGSSPPEITTFDHENDELISQPRRNSDTPANQQPSIHPKRTQERIIYAENPVSSQQAGPRPVLSPIRRAGTALQNILSDPPSPSSRSSVLRSPFKGSARNSSPLEGQPSDDATETDASANAAPQSHPEHIDQEAPQQPTQSPRKTWAMSFAPLSQIKNLVTQGAQIFTSPSVNVSQDLDDPFGPSSPTREKGLENARGSAFMDLIRQASHEGSVHCSRDSIARATVGDNDERSWTSEPASTTRQNNGDHNKAPNTSMYDAENFQSSVRQDIGDLSIYDGVADKEPGVVAADRKSDETQTGGGGRHDISLVDELHSEEAEQPLKDAQADSEDDDIQMEENEMQLDDAPPDDEGSEEDDIWAIEANRSAYSPKAPRPQDDSFNPFRKSGLSVDWGTRSMTSSRKSLTGRSPSFKSARGVPEYPPENLEDYSLLSLHSGNATQSSAKKPTPEAQKQPKRVDLSDFFSSSPNFIERERRAKEASLARTAAQESAANLAHVASPEMTGMAQDTSLVSRKQLPSDRQHTVELPSPAPGASRSNTEGAVARSSSTPERPRVPQQAFNHRHGQNDAALFETWSVSSSRAPTDRPYASGPLSDARPTTPEYLDRDESSFEAPDLRPLPGRAASPSKSCLRSPLKTKTPGRVVEFTSSTLSPTAQAQARADAQKKSLNESASTSVRPGGPPLPGKPNQESSLDSYIRSSPKHKHLRGRQRNNSDSPLSQKRWSRRHWLFLDELLQAHRRSPLEFQLKYSSAMMTSPRKRKSGALLGKMVTSQGESMLLEQWHLDIVDAFKKEVGGWPEDALAKRLFALIVGEERRRLGLVPARR